MPAARRLPHPRAQGVFAQGTGTRPAPLPLALGKRDTGQSFIAASGHMRQGCAGLGSHWEQGGVSGLPEQAFLAG